MAEQRSPKPCVVGSNPTRPVKLYEMIGKVQKFVSEVITELKKVSWSTRRDLIDATWIVFLSSILLGVFIGTTDFVLSKLLEIVIG